ncbi:MAG: hypothetical protein CVU57_00195 [Deltaproteobacteria bacterium HGW-Deltaproteobacteria-15]|nr:MAG: hypothetical protein CVU57_00195 [Deltaproteobacteria bacterium HGW-Deltaproteobacteria-15]
MEISRPGAGKKVKAAKSTSEHQDFFKEQAGKNKRKIDRLLGGYPLQMSPQTGEVEIPLAMKYMSRNTQRTMGLSLYSEMRSLAYAPYCSFHAEFDSELPLRK